MVLSPAARYLRKVPLAIGMSGREEGTKGKAWAPPHSHLNASPQLSSRHRGNTHPVEQRLDDCYLRCRQRLGLNFCCSFQSFQCPP